VSFTFSWKNKRKWLRSIRKSWGKRKTHHFYRKKKKKSKEGFLTKGITPKERPIIPVTGKKQKMGLNM